MELIPITLPLTLAITAVLETFPTTPASERGLVIAQTARRFALDPSTLARALQARRQRPASSPTQLLLF